MFCKHKWEILSEKVTDSKFDNAMKSFRLSSDVKIPHQMCCAKRKHIQVFACAKCGKLKRFVEAI